MTRRRCLATASLVVAAMGLAPMALAEDALTLELSLQDKAFMPAEIRVPAGKPFIIKFKNLNAAPAELEAKELKIEKVAAGNSEIVVRVRAMPAGKYPFVNEYQEDVAQGFIIAE